MFALLKRGEKVFTVPVSNTKTARLLPIIRQKIKPDSVVYTDGHTGYNALDVSEFNHFRINYSIEFVCNHNHINGIENFCSRILKQSSKIKS